MKILGPFLAALLIYSWIAGQLVAADDYWWAADNGKTDQAQKTSWNPLTPIDAGIKGVDRGLKKIGNGTKRLFSNAGDALRLKSPASKKVSKTPHLPWIRPAKPEEEKKKSEKPSWLGSWFQQQEKPRPSSSIEDFLDAGRLDP